MDIRNRIPLSAKRLIRHLYEAPQRLLLDPLIHLIQRRLSDMPLVRGRRNRLILGRDVSLSNTLFNTVSGTITVGDDTFFGHNCMVLTGTHELSTTEVTGRLNTFTPAEGRDIMIGRRCWIASGAILLGPVTIGDGAVVAAGAVVRSDVPKGAFAAGVPARVVPRKSAQDTSSPQSLVDN